jgi:hypothetical protein
VLLGSRAPLGLKLQTTLHDCSTLLYSSPRSIARAVYSDADVYLLDDPLSAGKQLIGTCSS